MSIQDELANELNDAMRSKDARRRDVIRQIQTEIATARSEPGFKGDLDDALYQKVIGSYVKKMDKSRAEYESYGDRGVEMADKLAFEVEYLSRWLPTRLDEEATRRLIEEAITELGVAGDEKAAGRVTGHLMKTRADDLDGGLVNRLVREALSGD
jgi:uncharacterized protein YqeY